MDIQAKKIFVFDTNVVVHAMQVAIAGSNSADLTLAFNLLTAATQQHHVCASDKTMAEIAEVNVDLLGKTRMTKSQMVQRIHFINHLQRQTKRVDPQRVPIQCRDPKDQMFLEAAMGASQRFGGLATIVTNDRDLLTLKRALQLTGLPIRVATPLEQSHKLGLLATTP
jgi:predicted nucleic acid-binding protein